MNTTIDFCIFELVYVPNFSLNRQFWFFGPNLPRKCVSGLKLKKWHWILHIWINLGTKFLLKLTSLIFWIMFVQKGYFQSKTNKMNSTIEFCIFELVWVTDFNLNWQFWFFYQICLKREFLVENGKIALVRASMVVAYYIKRFPRGPADITVF